jgi:hypothetical protein
MGVLILLLQINYAVMPIILSWYLKLGGVHDPINNHVLMCYMFLPDVLPPQKKRVGSSCCIILVVYLVYIVSNKISMDKILFSLSHRVWVWIGVSMGRVGSVSGHHYFIIFLDLIRTRPDYIRVIKSWLIPNPIGLLVDSIQSV